MSDKVAFAWCFVVALALSLVLAFLKGAWAQENWYHAQEINPEARARLQTSYKSCCGAGDVFRTRFRLINDGSKFGVETYEYLQDGAWKVVPLDIIKRAKTPDGQPVLFLLENKTVPVCFIIDEEGI